MDPFTQRMLERARARQEKIDQKLANSGQSVPKRKPLSENVSKLQTSSSPVKSPSKTNKDSVLSPRKSVKSDSPLKTGRKSVSKTEQVLSPPRVRNDVMVTKKEFRGAKRGSMSRRDSDVSVEINIMHRNDIQIEVQVEERDAPISIYDSTSDSGSSVTIKEVEDPSKTMLKAIEMDKSDRSGLRHNIKSRLDRLGNLYSDNPNLSSPIHRTEMDFSSATPPSIHDVKEKPKPAADGRKKFGRLAALADEINNWEDDLTHHGHQAEPPKKTATSHLKEDKLDSSTLDVSINSIQDINTVLQTTSKSAQKSKPIITHTITKPQSNECQRLNKKIVAELEDEGYRRVSAGQSRLVYDFTSTADNYRQKPNAASTRGSKPAAPKMAAMVANPPPIAKKPSIKKYKAPTPPRNVIDCESEKDKENNVLQTEENHNGVSDCKQTKPSTEVKPVPHGSPVVMRVQPKLNGNVDRNSVLSKAAMFEAGSPRAKDPAEMSLRERKALFEKNKGAAIVPKAPFGLAPSAKTLLGDTKADKPRPTVTTPTKPTKPTKTTREEDDNISQTSVGGIKGKLAALFNKEQTISETTIANKFKQEREREMEMLQNRFHYKPKPEDHHISDDEPSDHDPSEDAPLMGSTTSLALANRKPEIIANIPKVKSSPSDEAENYNDKVGSQPVKRRSSQDSPVVLSVLEDVKRIKVNDKKEQTNGTVVQQPTSLYPHLSDIETDNSNTQEEYSDCGGSMENINDKLNKSDNWAETSFGREVMNVVKKNNTSYKKAVRESDSDNSGACDSELDDMLDEALEDQSEGPTPPKKHGSLSSSSFVYQQKQFKSPLKSQLPTPTTPALRDKANELVHSVSFYRRMQSASSNPSTPMRLVRHSSPDREIPAEDDTAARVTTVKQRIKELNAEIAKQQTVISQASQALNLCASTVEFSGSTEQAEGERLLLLATHRRQACVHEVQRLQVEGAGCAGAAGGAALHIQGITVPLRREYVRALNADGAVGHHALCLLKCRDRVLATSMQLTQPANNTLHFPDIIRMDGLASDFKVTVEVYLLQASKEMLPHDVKYHIFSKKSSSKLLTPKSKVSELKTPRVQSPAGPQSVRSPQFSLHGYCIFALQQASRKTFTLNKLACDSPLSGSLSMEIAARVSVPAPPPRASFLTAFDDVSGLGAWHRRWFSLQPPRMHFWKYPDDVQKKLPIGDIDLCTVVSEKVVKAPRDLCARPNTILLETSVPQGLIVPESGSLVYTKRADGTVVRRHLLAADTPTERDVWLDSLNKALEYVRCCTNEDE